MNAWVWAHLGAVGTALGRHWRHPFAAFFEILVLGIALTLPAGLFLAVDFVRGMVAQLPRAPEVSVFLHRSADAARVSGLATTLKTIPGVTEVRFIDRQDAAKQLRKSTGMAEVLDALPENPLPDAFILILEGNDAARIDEVRQFVAKLPGVEMVQADSAWVRKVETGVRVAQTSVLVLAVLFGIAALTVTFNTVRLQMLARREEIQLSRLIGATDAFVRRPFVYFGMIQGFLGGVAALAILTGARAALAPPLTEFSMAYGFGLETPDVPPEWIAGFVIASALLGATAAWTAATRHLWVRDLRRPTSY